MYFVIKLFFLIWLASEKVSGPFCTVLCRHIVLCMLCTVIIRCVLDFQTRGAIVVYTILRPHLIMVDQKLSALLGGVPAEKVHFSQCYIVDSRKSSNIVTLQTD